MSDFIQYKSDFIFTQYLYIKDEVRISLLVSILNKSDDALFWAFELYHSGFRDELFHLIWKIYYDFFACINSSYEPYLRKKHKEFTTQEDTMRQRIICSVIKDLLFRPFNTDIFMLRNITNQIEPMIITNSQELEVIITCWINTNDYRTIAGWVFKQNEIPVKDVYTICLSIFKKRNEQISTKMTKMLKDFMIAVQYYTPQLILLVKIMQLFSLDNKLKKGKKIYIISELEDIIMYEPISEKKSKSYKILPIAYKCGINDLKMLSLFKLTRDKYNIQDLYWNNWEYYASFSPLWFDRIKQFGGCRDYENKKIIFNEEPTDDLMQEFYELYGLEPDEQPIHIQNKSIQQIEKVYNWVWFNNQYNHNGLFQLTNDEIQVLDKGGLEY